MPDMTENNSDPSLPRASASTIDGNNKRLNDLGVKLYHQISLHLKKSDAIHLETY